AAIAHHEIAVLRRRADDLIVLGGKSGVLEAHLQLLRGNRRVADGRRGIRLDQLAQNRVAELMEVGCRRLLGRERRRRARDGERGAANAFECHWGTPASAATRSAAHCGPRYALAPSSYHSPSECAPCASPPPPMRIAGIPNEIGMFASVLDAVVD